MWEKNKVTVYNLCRFWNYFSDKRQWKAKSRRVLYEHQKLILYQKHIACSYDYKLVSVDDKFSKPFETYLGKDAIYNFINNMIEECKYCIEVMKKHFNKELVMTKENNENFNNSTKCWICDNDYVDNNVKVRNNCHHWKIQRLCT